MTDSIGLYAGIKPLKNAKEYGYFEMNVGGCQFQNDDAPTMRNIAAGYFTPPPKNERELNDTLSRSTLAQVLPLIGRDDSIRYGKCELAKNDYMRPPSGYMRHQKKGLAYDIDKPINGKIMPISDFYNINQHSSLGDLKGSSLFSHV